MMCTLIFTIALFLLTLCSAPRMALAQENDIRAITVLDPQPNQRTPIAVPTRISIRFQNNGTSDQHNVRLVAIVKDGHGNTVYRDTAVVPNWVSGATLDTQFHDWIPTLNGIHSICGIAMLAGDAVPANDSSCETIAVAYTYDVQADSVTNPQPGEVKLYGSLWQPEGLLESIGVADVADIPIRVRITRCSDQALVYQADSLMSELNFGEQPGRYRSPSRQGPYDITKLQPGCYVLSMIARRSNDGDRTNDTARTTFSIAGTGSVNDAPRVASISSLQVYPNPATTSTTIHFVIPEFLYARIAVVDLLGREVAQIFSGELGNGERTIPWNATGFAPGMYDCLVTINGKVQHTPLLLVR